MEVEKSNESSAVAAEAKPPQFAASTSRSTDDIDVPRGKKRAAPSTSGKVRPEDRKRSKKGKESESAEKLVNWTLERQYQLRKEPSVSSGEDTSDAYPIGIGKTECGHLIMACNAKGMPDDHNERTAYFIIWSDINHGDELKCSHLLCQKEGLKFKYCSFCQSPVPKLNFSTRHDHSQQRKHEGSDESESQGGTASRDQADIPYQVTTKQQASSGSGPTDESASNSSGKAKKETKKVSESSSNLGSTNNTSSEAQTSTAYSETSSLRLFENSSASSVAVSRGFADEAGGVANLPQPQYAEAASLSGAVPNNRDLEALHTARRYEWARLLGRRPGTDDRSVLSQWLLDVLAISDLHAPLEVEESASSPTTDASNDSSSETRETHHGSMDNSAPTDQSGTAGSSRTDGSSANDYSSDTRETNNQSTDSNDSANDSASDTQEPANTNIV